MNNDYVGKTILGKYIYKKEKLDEQLEILKKAGYKRHHASLNQGYVRVKTFEVEPYEGRFGKGFKYGFNNPQSSWYKIVEYWVKDEEI